MKAGAKVSLWPTRPASRPYLMQCLYFILSKILTVPVFPGYQFGTDGRRMKDKTMESAAKEYTAVGVFVGVRKLIDALLLLLCDE